jgi:primase-polymerase (primpol)-like protein
VSALERIPAELRECPQWVVWRLEEVPGKPKPTKMPYRADGGGKASSTDPATWTTFEAAVRGAESADGIGFVFSENDPYAGVDLDEGLNEAEQELIFLALDSYTERSVSGAGYHVLVRANLNGRGHHPHGLGVFDRARFFVMTGEHVADTPLTIEHRQSELDAVLAAYVAVKEPTGPPLPPQPVDVDDQELLERMFASKSGDKIRRLWEGDWSGYASQSEGDCALLTHLAFWTDRDAPRMESLFRTSGL